MTRTPSQSTRPQRIGPYQILDLLGEGGMGTVYLAEQHEPVRRRVALKVIKLGMDSQQVLQRFETERRALALMEHPNIAHVFDCGTTDSGQPYFAMEFVEGIAITKYSDQARLGIAERVRLFQDVCAGVQHAHQKGVVHRDLTPNNVLVAVQDGKPNVKIIDFGLARATEQQELGTTMFTQEGQIVGTPEYMSPEQTGRGGLDVDTRSDVYTLGVLLYELLVGEMPFARAEVRKQTFLELQRRICDEEPPRPSTRLSTATEEVRAVAERRDDDPKSLLRAVRGDLDWIVMRAIEKDRERRYQTPSALAEDLARYLADEPVLAGPPSAAYRVRKFVRRYRGQVVAGALLVLSLLVGVAGTTHFMLEARAQAEIARESEAEADKRAVAEARARAEAVANLDKFNLLANVVNLREARAAEATLYPAWPERAAALRGWIAEAGEPLAATLPRVRATLDELRLRALPARDGEAPREWRFAEKGDQFLHDTLARLVADLEEFVDAERGALAAVRERLQWAETIEQRSIFDHEARWNDARNAIERADGETASEAYAAVALDLEPQLGLVPIGPNPVTRLWEFHHLRSAAPGAALPEHASDGSLAVGPDTGIVFVLVPGGRGRIGAQSGDPRAPLYDPDAQQGSEVREVELAPFFAGRYEITQAQWRRLAAGDDPSGYGEGRVVPGMTVGVTLAHPVEQVSWTMASDVLRRHALRLPSEAEWEFACRAGTETPWSSGEQLAEVAHVANVADATAQRHVPAWTCDASLDDGCVIHAPVGSFLPNAFGLHDVHGNVWEWCEDPFGPAGARVLKGGSFVNPARLARSGARNTAPPDTRSNNLGVRAFRGVMTR